MRLKQDGDIDWGDFLVEIVIDGMGLVSPDVYGVGFEDIGEFNRNANGDLVGDLVAVKAVVSCGWRMISGDDYGRLVRGASPLFVNVRYFCPKEQKAVEKMMYAQPKAGRIVVVNGELWWKDVGCEFVEK
ncbi:MAG: hypothetical protein FWE33_01710 [Defluviitaleaceae bacterium]|nr:hypothetical protein [Defluviitaleaceae bacterium]